MVSRHGLQYHMILRIDGRDPEPVAAKQQRGRGNGHGARRCMLSFYDTQDQFFTELGVVGAMIVELSGLPVTVGSVLCTVPSEGTAG